jgi:hypothetical protein
MLNEMMLVGLIASVSGGHGGSNDIVLVESLGVACIKKPILHHLAYCWLRGLLIRFYHIAQSLTFLLFSKF